MQAGGVAGAFEYSCVVYAGGRFQLLLLTTCIHLSLILLLYYYILLLLPLLPLLLFILLVVLTTRFICVEPAQNCFMNGIIFMLVFQFQFKKFCCHQGGRTWQPFVGSKNGDENFRQARIHNFRDKCVVFVRNCKFANFTKICYIYHVIVHFLPKKHCFWPKRALFLPKDLQKVRKSRQILICDKIAYVRP